jgi:hypothetical protein
LHDQAVEIEQTIGLNMQDTTTNPGGVTEERREERPFGRRGLFALAAGALAALVVGGTEEAEARVIVVRRRRPARRVVVVRRRPARRVIVVR